MKKQKTYIVSANFQLAFSAAVLSAFALQSGWLLWTWAEQFSNNPFVNGFEWWVSSTIVLPLAFFALAWVLRPKQATKLAAIFDSLLVSVAAITVYSVVNMISQQLYQNNITPNSGYELGVTYEFIGAGIFLSLYLAALLYLRKTHNWR